MKVVQGAVLLLVVLVAGCPPDSEGTACEPGDTQICNCTPDLDGVQVCRDDGTGWTECECDQGDDDSAGDDDVGDDDVGDDDVGDDDVGDDDVGDDDAGDDDVGDDDTAPTDPRIEFEIAAGSPAGHYEYDVDMSCGTSGDEWIIEAASDLNWLAFATLTFPYEPSAGEHFEYQFGLDWWSSYWWATAYNGDPNCFADVQGVMPSIRGTFQCAHVEASSPQGDSWINFTLGEFECP